MPARSELMAAGIPALAAQMLASDPKATIASAGSTQATATALTSNFAVVSGTGGVLLPPCGGAGMVVLYPTGAATVYPNGTDSINALSGGTGLAMTANRAQMLLPCGTSWIAVGSAN